MLRSFGAVLALLATAITISACVVEAPRPVGCRWVPPHVGPEGGYHRGHCA